jgi:broad specificity phosphatase PhoE
MSVHITNFAHGTTIDNENNISSGWSDTELSELGIRQARELGDLVKDKKFDVVFCSDLKRAFDTAKLAFGDVPIIKDSRLRECDYGKFDGFPTSVVEPMCESECIKDPFEGGESYEDVKIRIADFLEFLKKSYHGKSIAVVSHKAPQLALDVLLKGKTWEEAVKEDWRKTKAWQPGWEYMLK